MPAYWQITKLRAEQTSAVWALSAGFPVGGKTLADLNGYLAGYAPLILALNTAETEASTAATAKAATLVDLHFFSVRGAGKLSAELEDDDELDIALGEQVFAIDPESEAAEVARARAFVPIWTKYDARQTAAGASVFAIRGRSLADFDLALTAYENALDVEKIKLTALSTARTTLEQHNRKADRIIKKWHAAWKHEYPEGTAEGDALLSQVEVPEGQLRPTKLEIAALANLSGLRVDFVPGGGAHATLRHLQVKVIGTDAAFRVVRELVPEDVAVGVEIGPFPVGAQVKVRTDVGNARDHSEISAEQSIVIA